MMQPFSRFNAMIRAKLKNNGRNDFHNDKNPYLCNGLEGQHEWDFGILTTQYKEKSCIIRSPLI